MYFGYVGQILFNKATIYQRVSLCYLNRLIYINVLIDSGLTLARRWFNIGNQNAINYQASKHKNMVYLANLSVNYYMLHER